MRVDIFNRFVQISVEADNPVLPKFLRYAKKHFQKQYHLSSSILILDDGERFKKDYLINWAYHLSMQSQDIAESSYIQSSAKSLDSSKTANPTQSTPTQSTKTLSLDSILQCSYLPIRIKIISTNSLLECVRISFSLLGLNRAVLMLDKQNHLAKRYISALLANIVISSDLTHIYLDCNRADFWQSILGIIGNKIIHNVRLEFDYDSFKGSGFGQKGFKSSYFTQKEQKLQKSYTLLGCSLSDSFFDIRAKYLELVKEYHPDKVFGQDDAIVQSYSLKFIELKEAFDIIKSSFEIAS